MSSYGVILFHTTAEAFAAEKALGEAHLECRLIPTPREFSSDCGVAARFEWSRAADVLRTLEEAHVELAAVHPLSS